MQQFFRGHYKIPGSTVFPVILIFKNPEVLLKTGLNIYRSFEICRDRGRASQIHVHTNVGRSPRHL